MGKKENKKEKKEQNALIPLAVTQHAGKELFYCASYKNGKIQDIVLCRAAREKLEEVHSLEIRSPRGKKVRLAGAADFRFFHQKGIWYCMFVRTRRRWFKKKVQTTVATSTDAIHFTVAGRMDGRFPDAFAVVSRHDHKRNYLAYCGNKSIQVAASENLEDWHVSGALLAPRRDHFDRRALHVMDALVTARGMLVLYGAAPTAKESRKITIGAALFAPDQPYKMLWRSAEPIWERTVTKESFPLSYLGCIVSGNSLRLFWASRDGEIVSETVKPATAGIGALKKGPSHFVRHHANPILKPKADNHWENEATLNPAAIRLENETHLVYRAIGSRGKSTFGYAVSKDGAQFDERLPHPIYFDCKLENTSAKDKIYSPVMYPSGGSWGGYEDPRMVEIDGRVYVTFNLFENWVLRVGFISISKEDFLAKQFHLWDGPHILSHGNRDKNWVLFPEKINGKFAVLHSIIGESDDRVCIEYIDDLKKLSQKKFTSADPQKIPDRKITWHTHVRSAGPPPLKTDRGWLLFYHANDQENHKYKVGAMILDLDDPTKIIARSQYPVLEPDCAYENDGKPGIVYASGATIHEGKIYLYYGGGDKVCCVASADLDAFLQNILFKKKVPELKA